MSAMEELRERLEKATDGLRELDRAIAFMTGVGTDLERKVYAEMGDASFRPDIYGLSPMDYKNGDVVKWDWVKGTRGKPGGNKPKVWLNCNGPRPLRGAPPYTASLDAAVNLIEHECPGALWRVGFDPDDASMKAEIITAAPECISAKANADTAPVALCIALLSTLISNPTDGGGA